MENFIEKMPKALRYIFAVPMSLIFMAAIWLFIYWGNRLFVTEDSTWMGILKFLISSRITDYTIFLFIKLYFA